MEFIAARKNNVWLKHHLKLSSYEKPIHVTYQEVSIYVDRVRETRYMCEAFR
jgi:hypothetical protein